MTSLEIFMGRKYSKEYQFNIDLYFDLKKQLIDISLYEVDERNKMFLLLQDVIRDIRSLDYALIQYREFTKNHSLEQPQTIQEMATCRMYRKLGDWSDKIKYVNLVNAANTIIE
jgi:hypothetical protein